MARLSARGVPLEAERGRGGGVRVPVRLGLGRLQLSHREALDLLLALAAGERMKSPLLLSSLKALRQKIAMAFPPEERSRVGRLRRRVLHGRPASPRVTSTWATPRPAIIAAIQDGFFEQRAVQVTYESNGETSSRLVEPHYLLLTWPAWYLLCWDHSRSAVRTLRLDRITSARITDEAFALRPFDSMLEVARDVFAPV